MKFIFILCCALCLSAYGQESKRALTLSEYDLIKSISFKNIDKKTSIREKGFLFSRPSTNVVFSLALNDGSERKIFLYKISEGTTPKGLGLLAVFSTPTKQIQQCIPNTLAPKEVWAKYIEDLKNNNKTTDGFAVCMAYVLSQLGPDLATESIKEEEDSNDFCFPAELFVNLADGTEKSIASIQVGDIVSGIKEGKVTQVKKHQGTFSLTRLLIKPNSQAWVSRKVQNGLIALEVTPNHPILTLLGKTSVNRLKQKDWVFVHDVVSGRYVTAEIVDIQQNARTVPEVYSLTTEHGIYDVEGIVVLDKH